MLTRQSRALLLRAGELIYCDGGGKGRATRWVSTAGLDFIIPVEA